jgi:hypothetical protein
VQGLPREFFIDHAHPFGAACASSNSSQPANAAIHIWAAEGVAPVPKYEDDLNAFRFPSLTGTFIDGAYSYDYDRAEMLRRIAPLDIPWHEEKGDEAFKFITTFIGFQWDIPNKLVSLTDEKRFKFLERVRQFIQRFDTHPCQLLDIQKIHGSLCHISFVYFEGRSHLASLSNFASTFPLNNDYAIRFPPPSVITDLNWWFATLSVAGVSRSLRPRGVAVDLGFFVDASTSWGIGIIMGNDWAAFRLRPSWKIPGRDICWLETAAIELLIYFLEARGLRDIRLIIHSDNNGTIGALDKGRSRNHHINLSVRRTYSVLLPLFITPDFIYVASADNPADPISRGESGPLDGHISVPFTLPDELRDCFIYE